MQKKWFIFVLLGLWCYPISFFYITAGEAIELVTVQPSESNTIHTTNKDINNGFEGDSRGKSGIIIEDMGSFQEQNQARRLLSSCWTKNSASF